MGRWGVVDARRWSFGFLGWGLLWGVVLLGFVKGDVAVVED